MSHQGTSPTEDTTPYETQVPIPEGLGVVPLLSSHYDGQTVAQASRGGSRYCWHLHPPPALALSKLGSSGRSRPATQLLVPFSFWNVVSLL